MNERDLEVLMMSLVNEGIMEQYIGEDGQYDVLEHKPQ